MSQDSESPKTVFEVRPDTAPKARPYQLIKLNKEDLTDKFSRKLDAVSPLLRKSMIRAYNQALTDAQFLLMAAEKDTMKAAK